jgi:hypothetical protein
MPSLGTRGERVCLAWIRKKRVRALCMHAWFADVDVIACMRMCASSMKAYDFTNTCMQHANVCFQMHLK